MLHVAYAMLYIKKKPKPTLQEGGIAVIREERRDSEI